MAELPADAETETRSGPSADGGYFADGFDASDEVPAPGEGERE